MKVRDLTLSEQRLVSAITVRLEDIERRGIPRPTHMVVNRHQFLGIGIIRGLRVIRAGYIAEDTAGLLVMIDDVARPLTTAMNLAELDDMKEKAR